MTPRLYRVILPVRDLDAARRFYEVLLGLQSEQVSQGRRYFDCGGVVLALLDRAVEGDDRPYASNPETVYFAVDDLEETRARAAAAGGAPSAIETRPWGETSFYVDDPDGNSLCFAAAGSEFRGGRFVP